MIRTEQLYKLGKSVDWTPVESNHSQTGELPDRGDVNAEVYHALISECDARKAEALVLDKAADPLLTVRSLLFRGRLQESSQLISGLKTKSVGAKSGDGERLAKLLTEEARLAAFNGDWKACERVCRKALVSPAPAVTRLTLLQIAALAYFEQGNFRKASFNLSLIESMQTAFPRCISAFYGELLRLRISAREGAREGGASSVRMKLRTLWSRWLAEPGDIDQLQALLRIEVDLRRAWGQPHFDHALGSYLVAQAMGENLYSSLALVECAVAAPVPVRDTFQRLARETAPSFARVRRIFDELEGRREPSTSVKTMREWLATPAPAAVSTPAFAEASLQAQALVLPEYGVVVSLSPYRVSSIVEYPQFGRMFEALAGGPLAKEEFFARVWGNQKYAVHLHDGLIYTALYRLKKLCGVPAVIRGGEVCVEDALVI